ncbi:MAG TPA: zinc finger Ran-binding domain-containing protein [bacterium]|nr:zinc finger Ran-binding domain-containing protein [bacterium]
MDSLMVDFFIITIILVEGWWIYFAYQVDQQIHSAGFVLLEILTVCCLILGFLSLAEVIKFRFTFLLPSIPIFSYIIVKGIYAILDVTYEKNKLRNEIAKASKTGSSKSFEKVGDIYFLKSDFENAILWYRKAKSIKETPEIIEKIDRTRKEILLKQKKLWICPECSITNSSKDQQCRSCGALKPSLKAVKKELSQASKIMKRDIFFLTLMVFVVSFLIWFIKNSGILMSIIVFCILFVPFAIYLLVKFFSG